MKAVFASLAVVAVVGALVWAPVGTAQQQPTPSAPPAGAPSAPAGMEKTIEGKVRAVDPAGKFLLLEDGTRLMIPDSVRVSKADLTPGATVKVAYEERGGHKIITDLQVSK
jgi:Protein of unknown function (DUF1344)